MSLTKEQIGILDHTVHRAAGGYYCGDSSDMQELVKLGMMSYAGLAAFTKDKFFRITGIGKKALRNSNGTE